MAQLKKKKRPIPDDLLQPIPDPEKETTEAQIIEKARIETISLYSINFQKAPEILSAAALIYSQKWTQRLGLYHLVQTALSLITTLQSDRECDGDSVDGTH